MWGETRWPQKGPNCPLSGRCPCTRHGVQRAQKKCVCVCGVYCMYAGGYPSCGRLAFKEKEDKKKKVNHPTLLIERVDGDKWQLVASRDANNTRGGGEGGWVGGFEPHTLTPTHTHPHTHTPWHPQTCAHTLTPTHARAHPHTRTTWGRKHGKNTVGRA